MTSKEKRGNRVDELEHFSGALERYYSYLSRDKKTRLTRQQKTEAIALRDALLEGVGQLKDLITELAGKETIMAGDGRDAAGELPMNMWLTALKLPYTSSAIDTLLRCIAITRMAVGRFKSDIMEDIRDEQGNLVEEHVKTTEETRTEHPVEEETLLSVTSGKANWEAIKSEFGITKNGFGRKINFIKDPFRRTIIFRDVEQAFVLASSGFSKPAVILAGGVIEELLRLYLQYKQIKPVKDDFDGYIQTCEQNRLLELGISRLSDSARHFRNLVHLSKEKTNKDTTSKSKAKGAVASIFTIADDF